MVTTYPEAIEWRRLADEKPDLWEDVLARIRVPVFEGDEFVATVKTEIVRLGYWGDDMYWSRAAGKDILAKDDDIWAPLPEGPTDVA